MGVTILGRDKGDQVNQEKREFKHRGFLRSRAEARRKGRPHKQTRSAAKILASAEYRK